MTCDKRSAEKIEEIRTLFGDKKLKTLELSSESPQLAIISVQPLGFEDGASSKPKSLQIRVGKAMVKKNLFCSGVRLARNDSTAAQASAICAGEVAAAMVAASSADFVCESVA